MSLKTLRWQIFTSVNNLPADLWRTTIGEEQATMGQSLFDALEKAVKEDTLRYLVCYKEENIIGVAFINLTSVDLALEAKGLLYELIIAIRKMWPGFMRIRTAMTGTYASVGKHWWFDRERIGEREFFHAFLKGARKLVFSTPLIIVRDFMGNETSPNAGSMQILRKMGFHPISYFPSTVLHLCPQTPKEFIGGMKRKARATLRKALSIAKERSLNSEVVDDFAEIVEVLYPLYLNTNKRAKEFRSNPLPKEFFSLVAASREIDSKCFIIRNNSGKIISFTLGWRSDKTLNAFCLGFDYTADREQLLIYQNYFLLVSWSLNVGVERIEMGLTNYFVKERFGCELCSMSFCIRFRNPALNTLMKWGLKLFEAKTITETESLHSRQEIY